MDNVTAGLYRPQPFLSTVKDAWNAFLSSRNGLCQVAYLTALPATPPSAKRQDRELCAEKTKQLTAHGPGSTVCSASLRISAEPAYWPTAGARAWPRARATKPQLQKGGMYPTFDSAAAWSTPLVITRPQPLALHSQLEQRCESTHTNRRSSLLWRGPPRHP